MKKSKLFAFGVIVLTMLMVSCNKSRKKLVDSWKVTEVEAKVPISDSVKNDILAKGTLTFTDDGYVSGHLERDFNDGLYILTKKGRSLTIKDETGTPFTYESTIEKDKMILEDEEMKITLLKD
ncbi:hypothetical protein [Flavobacterium sp. UMI-01]|uniref:hypothetical protein n=1 Tax=Flavobacterium sp. UMI-01 TaxID=1441053 RepID=UPI001C7D42B7|nr:hypothetical protein [Flavobacterium sp. UMI-01]GIZ08955.1 hypothetical protein FUMI01_16820 [Flavobacterium sp. UMI-01]